MIFPISISFVLVLLAYFLGSIPSGYIAGKVIGGIDIREHGSGSTGATNVLRTLGKLPALIVFITDVGKGSIALLSVKLFFSYYPLIIPDTWHYWLITLAGLSVIFGHSKSIWLNFTGGKSVATSLGVMLMMNPLLGLGVLGTFGICLAITRIVSLSSIVGAISVSAIAFFLNQPLPYILFGILAGVYVIFRHQTNIQRLLLGEEPKIGEKAVSN